MKNRTGRAKDIQAGPSLVRLLSVSFTQTFGHSFKKNKEYEKIDKSSPGKLSNQNLYSLECKVAISGAQI